MDLKRILTVAIFAFALGIIAHTSLFAQDGVLIDPSGTLTRHSSAVFQVSPLQSTSPNTYGGFLAPQVALTASNAAAPITTPATGLLVYNTATAGTVPNNVTPGYYYWDGGWKRLMSGNTTPLSGSGAATRVAFWDGVNSLSSDADLYWDNSAKRLGVGITSPGQLLDVDGSSRFRNTVNFGTTDNEGLISWTNNMGNGEAGLVIRGQTSRGILLGANNASHVLIDIAGNVGIGTATGPGQKLDVAGGSIRTTHQLISTIATGTSPMQVSSTTLNTNLNADLLDGWHAKELQFQQSNRNFLDGTLIQTDINYAVTGGDPWLLEIEGNSYGSQIPFDIKVQGYIYYDSLINVGGISNGTNISGISAFNYNGNLCFWFPRQTYWQGFSVFVNSSYAGTKHNRLVSITDQAKPAGITKEVKLSPKITQSWHSGNFSPTSYAPTTGGTGYIQNQVATDQPAGFRINGHGLFNGGSVGIGTTSPGGYRLNVQGGSVQTLIQSSSDAPLVVRGTDSWAGIGFQDVNGSDNFWYNGQHSTYAIGGGGSNVSGKKLHIDGATSIGSTYDADAAPADGLIVQGNVGIATTGPSTKLHINLGAGGANSTPALRIDGLSNYPSLELGIKGNYDGMIRTFGNDLHLYAGHWRTSGTNATENHNMSFYTSQSGNTNWETPKMYVRYDGNVGINTTSPSQKLTVAGNINKAGSWIVGDGAWGVNTFEVHDNAWDGSSNGNYGGIVGGHGYFYTGLQSGGSSGSEAAAGQLYVAETSMLMGSVGVGTASPTVKLDVKGDMLRTSTRISSTQRYPVAHSAGDDLLGIDPTWSEAELQAYFGSTNVEWSNDANAPSGYSIKITGKVNVGGAYGSGFPYIPIESGAQYHMECWIKNTSGSNGHYMGSIDYDRNFSSLGGNPGSYGYYTMSNYNPGSSWTKVTGTISGYGSVVGTFKNGSKYWTPMALFNFTGGGSCEISGWKVTKQKGGCRICLYWSDSDGALSGAQKRCASMTSGSVSSYMDFSGDMDGNDRMWIGFECD